MAMPWGQPEGRPRDRRRYGHDVMTSNIHDLDPSTYTGGVGD